MTVAVEIDERIDKCRKILDLDPNSQIFAALAEAYRKKGELDKAFRICQNGLRVHPSYGSAHIVMAKINLDRGLYDWAEVEVNKAIEIDGKSRAIELLLAEIFLYKQDYSEAAKLLKKLKQIDPDNEHISKLLDLALKIPEEEVVRPAPVSSGRVAVEAERQSSSPEPEPRAEPSPLGAAELLREAMLIPNIQGGLFINDEGLVIESEWAAEMDASVCGAALAEVDRHSDRELVEASFGRVNTVLIETGDFVFYLLHVARGMILLVGDSGLNLGGLRMKVPGLIERYRPN